MIDLYTWDTPNGAKARIMLEECGLDYTLHPVDLARNEQHTPAYLKINPNGKIPAIVDADGPGSEPFTVFESGAILIYLAEKTGRLLPGDPRLRSTAIQWLMFQMGGIGPSFGQLAHFLYAAPEPIPYAVERFADESQRLAEVVDHRLQQQAYLAGEYSVADIACFSWLARHERLGIDLDDLPHLHRWLAAVSRRPAVQRGTTPIV